MKKKFGFVLAAAILLAGCGQKKETTTTTARPVKTTIVESRSIIRKDFSGIVEAVEYVKLAFRVNGQIIQLPVIEGQKVKKGQLIAAIDPRDIALQYAATKSAYETASAQVERNKRLLSRQAISVQEYEISLANFQKAKSEYELSANNMRDTKLTERINEVYPGYIGSDYYIAKRVVRGTSFEKVEKSVKSEKNSVAMLKKFKAAEVDG